jgi:hypothetical protein
MSAETPAPEDGSNPAIVRTVCINRHLTVPGRKTGAKQPETRFFNFFEKYQDRAKNVFPKAVCVEKHPEIDRISTRQTVISFTTLARTHQAEIWNNSIAMFDLAALCHDNSRWSSRHEDNSFSVARPSGSNDERRSCPRDTFAGVRAYSAGKRIGPSDEAAVTAG